MDKVFLVDVDFVMKTRYSIHADNEEHAKEIVEGMIKSCGLPKDFDSLVGYKIIGVD